jgi:hypothetical protein
MALNKLEANLDIIAGLGNTPGPDDGLSPEQLKAKFDEAANIIKDYLNSYLIPELDKTVDVEALLADLLDTTLSRTDRAANAAAVGEAIRDIRRLFEKTVHSGSYVLKADGGFDYEISGTSTIRVSGGHGVFQGNLFSLNIGSYQDIVLPAGSVGLSRNDLIVIRCTKDNAGALSYALASVTGANTSGEPADPSYNTGDINADATVSDFPLYRVTFAGGAMSGPEALFTAEGTVREELDKLLEALKFYIDAKTVVLPQKVTAGNFLIGKDEEVMEEKTPEEVYELIGGYKMVKIWENASPGSTFASQTITLDLTPYDMVAVKCNYGTDGNRQAATFAYATIGGRFGMYAGYGESMRTRMAEASETGVVFYPGYVVGGNTFDAACVPVEIYGIRGAF